MKRDKPRDATDICPLNLWREIAARQFTLKAVVFQTFTTLALAFAGITTGTFIPVVTHVFATHQQ
jgi:hypothetical protein